MSTQSQLSPLEQLMQQNPPDQAKQPTQQSDLSPLEQLIKQTSTQQPKTQPSNLSPLEQLMAMKPQGSQDGGPTQEEQELLAKNPDYKFLAKDSRFPNRQPGVYPMGPGNEWRDDPNGPMATTTQAPIDPHLLKHSAEGAAVGAAGAGSAMALPLAAPVIEAIAPHLPNLDKAYKILTAIGAGTYTVQHLKDVLKIIGGASGK